MITGIALQFRFFEIRLFYLLFWHMLMLGWITQIIMGVSLWMFPGRVKEESFKNQKWSWIAFISLNIGLWTRVIAESGMYYLGTMPWNAILVISSIIQLIAILSYSIEIWPRIKSKKKRTVIIKTET